LLRIDAEAIVYERDSDFDYQRRVSATIEETGTVRALAICKSTHPCRSFNTITGVTPETENPDWLPSTSHALPCLYVLIVIGLNWETTLAKGMAMLKVSRHQQPILAAAAPHALY
jgi:hypothetical protein